MKLSMGDNLADTQNEEMVNTERKRRDRASRGGWRVTLSKSESEKYYWVKPKRNDAGAARLQASAMSEEGGRRERRSIFHISEADSA